MGRKKKKEPEWEAPPELDEEAEQAALAALLADCEEDEPVQEEKPKSAVKKAPPQVTKPSLFPLITELHHMLDPDTVLYLICNLFD